MTWQYQNTRVEQLPKDCVGFVYEIICLENNRRYIGKKLAKFKTLRYKMHTQDIVKVKQNVIIGKHTNNFQKACC